MTQVNSQIRFPESIQLFRFCFCVLEKRCPHKKLNDQHLGEILEFSPSDTSHWKRGKKNLNNDEYLIRLSKYLNIDLEILEDLADGDVSFKEALAEFQDAEGVKNLNQNSASTIANRLSAIEKIVTHFRFEAGMSQTPIDIHQLMNVFPFIQLIPSDSIQGFAISSRIKPGRYFIRHSNCTTKPYIRFAIAREIGQIILTSERSRFKDLISHDFCIFTDTMLFATALLIPKENLVTEVARISTRTNLIQSLSKKFCMPKSAIRTRLATLLIGSFSQLN